MNKSPTSGLVIAGAVAAMFAVSACGEDEADANANGTSEQAVQCYGINDCAGHGECANPGQGNTCQGENECAGMGWVTTDSADECTDAGGTVLGDA